MDQLLLRILRSDRILGEGAGKMNVVIQRPYVFLEKQFQDVFKESENSRVIVDRRYGERRMSKEQYTTERRRADRRKLKPLLVEAFISI